MTTAADLLEAEVRELVLERGLDPLREGPSGVAQLVEEVIQKHRDSPEANRPTLANEDLLKKSVVDSIAGFGPLQPLLDDPEVEEIWINGPGKVFCARNGQHELTSIMLTPQQIESTVERMLRSSGRRLDLSSPFVDATLIDGSRLHVAIPDVTRRHWAVNIRRFVLRAQRLDELVRLGALPQDAALFLDAAVRAGLNIVVSGATQSGKTTMLNCLAAAIPPRERVITCEEVFELRVAAPDVVSMQTRQANVEGRGAIDLRRLVIEALRMRPDRIIVGEVREREALDLLVALNSGLPGMTSIHANNATEALRKLTTLPLLAGENVSHAFVVPTVASSVDLVIHLVKDADHRRVSQILGVSGRVEGDRIEAVELFSGKPLRWTGFQPPRPDRFTDSGIDLTQVLR